MSSVEKDSATSQTSDNSSFSENNELSSRSERISEDDYLGLRGNLYPPGMDASKVRSSLHVEAITIRDELQEHLSAAMQNGDELLDKVRDVVESLDVAIHEKELAIQQRTDAERRREEGLKELRSMVEELKTVRQTLVDMMRQRDDALIKIETHKGQVQEKVRELNAMEKEGRRTKVRISQLEIQAGELRKKTTTAEAEARRLKIEYEENIRKFEELRRTHEEYKNKTVDLEDKISTFQLEIKTLRQSDGLSKQQVLETQSRLEMSEKLVKDAYSQRDHAIEAQRDAIKARVRSNEDRESAVTKEKEALHDRNTAREERDAVIKERDDMVRRVKDLQQSLVDVRHTQATERQEMVLLRKQLEEAIRRAEASNHFKLETLEYNRKLDLQRYELQTRIEALVKERDTAAADFLAKLATVGEEKASLKKEQETAVEKIRKEALVEFRGTEDRWRETVEKVRLAAEKAESGMGVSEQLLKKTVEEMEQDEIRLKTIVGKLEEDDGLKKIVGKLEEDESKLRGTAGELDRITDREIRKYEATIPF